MGKQRDLADGADVINFIDGLTSDVQEQLDTLDPLPSQSGQSGKYLTTDGSVASWGTVTTDPTLGTLTKTFTQGEASTINLTSSVLAPVVSVTKEVPQSGVTNNNWDVNSTTENYTRLNSAPATTLSFEMDLPNTTYSQSFSVASQDTNPQSLRFNTDGTKMFVIGNIGDDVNEYTLSTAFDISTASFVDSFSVTSQESSPLGLEFNNDGTKMYVIGAGGDSVFEYTLSTGFDVSTASYTQGFSVSAQETRPSAVTFNSDGTKMFVIGYDFDNVNEYTLSTGFDVSTATYSQNFSVTSQDGSPYDIQFTDNGTKMYILGGASDAVYEYSLTTGYDVSTASYSSNSFSVSSQDATPTGLTFSSDKSKMFITGSTNDSVYQYSSAFSLALGTGSFASADVGKTIEANSGEFVLTATDGSYVETTAPTSYDQVASGSWEMYGVVYNAADGDLELSWAIDPATKFDVSTAAFVDSFSVSQDLWPEEIAFNSDGTKMFIVGSTNDSVFEYILSTGFDVSTASYSQNFSVSAQESGPSGIAFNNDGTKMFIVGTTGDDVNEYTLSTGFDVSTAAFVDAFSVAAQDSSPEGIAFNNDGTKMFIVGSSNDSVFEYTLGTGFDVSTSSYSQSFSVATEENVPQGIAFNTDGTKMFIVGSTGDDVNEYTLSTGFDVSTAAFIDSFSVLAQDQSPQGIAFNTDGSKMFIVGFVGKAVYEYNIGTAVITTGYQPVHTTASIDSTYWTDINSMTADQAAGDGNVYYAISTDDRTTWTVIDNTDGERDIVRNNAGTWQYNSNGTYALETWVNGATNTELATLAEAMEGAETTTSYSLNGASYSSLSFTIGSQETNPRGMTLNSTGTKMYVVGPGSDTVYQYSLSTAWDVSTSSYDSVSFSVASQETSPWGLTFNSDGTKMYILGTVSKQVFQYTLSTAFDLSTASYSGISFNPTSQAGNPLYLTFNTDGTIMYIGDYIANVIYQYALATAFNVNTASYSSISYAPSGETSQTFGLEIDPTGTKAFILSSLDAVHQYSLSTAFDISTATYDSLSLDLSPQDTQNYSIHIGDNGSKLYSIGNANDSVYQYSIFSIDYTNQMDKTQLDAVTDPNHIALSNDLDLSIIFNMTSGSTVPSSDGVAINYDANVLNKGAVLGTDYDFDAPAQDKVRITALAGNNLKVRIV